MEGPKVIGHGKLVNASTGLHTTWVSCSRVGRKNILWQ